MAWTQETINELYAAVVSPCKQIGAFRSSVLQHEPKSAPAALPALALWWSGIGPARGVSGLNATAARVEFRWRAYMNFKSTPEDKIDPLLTTVVSQLFGIFTGAFTLGGEVMEVDLLGAYGEPLSATAGYIAQDGQEFRVAEGVIPLICDGLWVQVA